jgi:hypothetical protein
MQRRICVNILVLFRQKKITNNSQEADRLQEIGLVDTPVALVIYDTGALNTRLCAAVQAAAANVQLTVYSCASGAPQRTLHVPTVNKPKFRSLIAVADGNADEILYTRDSKSVLCRSCFSRTHRRHTNAF